jgi:ABC-type xylose transport system substrate-binding protein
MQARAVLEAAPEGNYVMIKGSPTDPNADFLRGGQQEVLQEAIDSARSPSSARPTPTSGSPRTRSGTWSRS